LTPSWSDQWSRIWGGDAEAVLPTSLPKGSVDLILTDPPYGITEDPFDEKPDLGWMWREFGRLLRKGGCIILTATQPFVSELVMSRKGWFRHEWIWRKTRAANFGSARYGPMKKHESVLVFAPPGKIRYRPVMEDGPSYRSRTQHPRGNTAYGTFGDRDYQPGEERTRRYPGTVLDFTSHRQQDLVHPSQKPLGLMEYLVVTYSRKGDVILDPYMGSGTTLMAARRLGRIGWGVEASDERVRVAIDRVQSVHPSTHSVNQ
jgi:site-specific DNA-methyltransferase (adenine-specific)